VTHQAQLEWERGNGRWAAGAAVISILFLVAGTVFRIAAIEQPDNDREALRIVDENGPESIAAAALQGVSLILLAVVVWFLYRAIRYRREEMNPVALVVGVAGPVLLAIGSVLLQLDRIDAADEFVSTGRQTEDRAEDLLRDASVASQVCGGAGQLGTAIAFVLIGLNGMRSGVLSRFMGILAVIIGALYVLPLVPGGQLILQLFWLGSLALIFVDRWPGGRGPAWDSGEADPWPSAAERRGLLPSEPPEADPEPEPEPEPSHPVSKKRKRKRRR
jgi:O-antigen/teichoic acid export membrane protein